MDSLDHLQNLRKLRLLLRHGRLKRHGPAGAEWGLNIAMKLLVGTLGIALLGGIGHEQETCGFNLLPASTETVKVIGSATVTSRFQIIKQADSPIEIVAADLTGVSFQASDGEYRFEQRSAAFDVRNRSDQT